MQWHALACERGSHAPVSCVWDPLCRLSSRHGVSTHGWARAPLDDRLLQGGLHGNGGLPGPVPAAVQADGDLRGLQPRVRDWACLQVCCAFTCRQADGYTCTLSGPTRGCGNERMCGSKCMHGNKCTHVLYECMRGNECTQVLNKCMRGNKCTRVLNKCMRGNKCTCVLSESVCNRMCALC